MLAMTPKVKGDFYEVCPITHDGEVTKLGFLLDSDNCIGCHACTVACKIEHDVPLGVNRT